MKDISTDAHIVQNITKTKVVCITTQKEFIFLRNGKRKIMQNKQTRRKIRREELLVIPAQKHDKGPVAIFVVL